jgi:hypothetical protein
MEQKNMLIGRDADVKLIGAVFQGAEQESNPELTTGPAHAEQ